MKAIILAAGRGSRMGHLTANQPKCLTKLHGIPLIEYQISALQGAGIKDIGIVHGYRGEMFNNYGTCHFYNQHWQETNMVYSLNCAKQWLEKDSCIISYSDITYSKDATLRLLSAVGDIVITYDSNWLELWQQRFENPLSDAETFQLDQAGYLKEVGHRPKSIAEVQGQYMGLLKITPRGWQQIINYLTTLTEEQRALISMTQMLGNLIDHKITAVPIRDKWYEVDSEKDLVLYHEFGLTLEK